MYLYSDDVIFYADYLTFVFYYIINIIQLKECIHNSFWTISFHIKEAFRAIGHSCGITVLFVIKEMLTLY